MPRPGPSPWMERALKLAARGAGFTSPNPMVGAVIIKESPTGDRLLGEGFHKKAGGPHAEIFAIEKGHDVGGAHLYVTLEPCSHVGRTGPCADAVIQAGIAEVTVAMLDPNPKVSGRGVRKLRRAGIKVHLGAMESEARRLNEKYIQFITTDRPFVTLKMAQTLDGKIADSTGESRWITGPESRNLVHQWRHEHDAVLVGAGTALIDDPQLNCRMKRITGRIPSQPTRIVVDPRWRLPLESQLVRTVESQPVIVIGRNGGDRKKREALEKAGVRVVGLKANQSGNLGWPAILKALGGLGITSILIEGGAKTAGSALAAQCVDRLALFMAPSLLADVSAPGSLDGPTRSLKNRISIAEMETRRVGEDWLLEGRPQR